VPERPFSLAVGDGMLPGHTGGKGVPALLLHGGPGLPDYLEGLAAELGDIFTTIRYTQRGTLPATTGEPYTVGAHMADAIAVLDGFGLEQAWAVGHSWGGHLALHLAVAHPERLYGVICVSTLGASNGVFPEFRANLRRGLSEEQIARLDELDALDDAGEASEADALEFLGIIWPNYFADPATAPPMPVQHYGLECSTATSASIEEHFEAGTLEQGLRKVKLPTLFVHGINDPLPISASIDTRKLVRGSLIARIPRCGHFPWLEHPGFTPRAIRGLFAQM
jgi:proline iminopeptidase